VATAWRRSPARRPGAADSSSRWSPTSRRARGSKPCSAALGAARWSCFVNNAGAAAYGPFTDLAPERLQELVRVNVDAVLALTHGLLPAMLARGRGEVINLASEICGPQR
jgi:NAD(P)-dependent dehydrogenase (short-subunit alcohol dehydrogenase family)